MKNSKIKSLIILALLFFPAFILYAVPAYPDPVTIYQPNGDTLTVFMKGDEKIHWCESLDGYTLFCNKEGYYTYAQLDEERNLQASAYIATDIEQRDAATNLFLSSIEKKLFFSEMQVEFMLEIWKIEEDYYHQHEPKESKAVNGKRKLIVVLVEFPDKPYKHPKEVFEELLNQEGYTVNGSGSVHDYYKEISYNKLDMTFSVFGVYTAPKDLTYYAGNEGHANVRELATWLVNQKLLLEEKVDFRNYDLNQDKIMDGFHFLFAGAGKEIQQSAQTIWSHAGKFSPKIINNGVELESYSCSPECRNHSSSSKETAIGVICHEMTHVLGAADYYDTNAEIGGDFPGTGNWDLMASGNYNGSSNFPAHPNIFIKIQFGWVRPDVLDRAGYVADMPNAAESPKAYRINTKTNGEYYLLENRQKVGFDARIPGDGLLVYHVHKDVGNYCINCTHPQRMYIVSAARNVQMPNSSPSSYGSLTSSCTFPTSTKNSLTDETTPAMRSWNNAPTEKPITNITKQGGLIGFDFMGGGPENIGIAENFQTSYENSLQLIPNPANNFVELRITNYEIQIESVEVFDVYGRRLMTFDFRLSTNKIDISHLPAGLYFVKAGNAVAKLIVN